MSVSKLWGQVPDDLATSDFYYDDNYKPLESSLKSKPSFGYVHLRQSPITF